MTMNVVVSGSKCMYGLIFHLRGFKILSVSAMRYGHIWIKYIILNTAKDVNPDIIFFL